MADCNASTVIRSESWVHQNAKECLDKIEVAREQKEAEIIQSGIEHINELRNRPIYRWWWYPALPKTLDAKSVRKWLREVDEWAMEGKDYYLRAEEIFKRLLNSTDPGIGLDHKMQLSTEDSAVLEKWIAWTPKKD